MRTIKILLVLLVCSSGSIAYAGTYDNFKQLVQSAYLKPFAKDLGGILGAGTFHSGKTLSFPGFDVGVHGAAQSKPNKDNEILKLAGVKGFGLPWVQVETALPLTGLDVMVRGMGAGGLTLIGGGLRAKVFANAVPMTPKIAISSFVDSLTHDFFSVTHISGNLAASLNLPIEIISPYVGVGVDVTHVKVKQSVNSTLVGLKETTTEPRFTVGVDFSPLPLLYMHGGYNLVHADSVYEFGLGVRF
ncbi:MAG: hypothetical protein HY399_07975 [Elusimicrobia bacterium]|nr:hypothetical protein [Elusimicrobiota bacterium]